MVVRHMLIASMLAAASASPLLAADYTVAIDGDAGATFAGTCLLVIAKEAARYTVSGPVPATFSFSGDIISCAVQKRTGRGTLEVLITGADGHVVAQSADVLPFGVVLAGGR
jgi:hypothetical protein